MRYFLLMVILLISLTCGAAIYMQKDANGNISYSDMPSPNALRVDLPPPTVTQFSTPVAPPVNKNIASKESKNANNKNSADANAAAADGHEAYSVFFISSPIDQQTFQNQRDLPVEVSITPGLQKGDSIQFILDGAKVGEPTATTHYQLNQLPRGSHQVGEILLDANKSELRQAPPVSFFVHYAALGGAQ
jgi:hypothetical protein